jgi:ferric-dicitrate binding protein FerR (iron transport regulator)
MTDEEDVTAQLLRLAGAPADPTDERTARVREAVHAEWQAHRRRRMKRRTAGVVIALLGVAASLLIVIRMNRAVPASAPPGETIVATGERILGQPLVYHRRGGTAGPEPLSISTPIRADDVIETDVATRASVLTADGSSVRIDRGSRVRFIGPAAVELIAGATYLTTAVGSHGFEVRTPIGVVRDMGTRFEVRLTESSLRVRVRAGTTEIRRGTTVTAATSGTEAIVTTRDAVVRQAPTYGPEWAWTTDLAPPFPIEGRPLRAFLEHLAAEEGWTLRYADASVADAAGRILLHGSVEGLSAEQRLGVAMANSGLQYRLRDGQVLVSKPAAAR